MDGVAHLLTGAAPEIFGYPRRTLSAGTGEKDLAAPEDEGIGGAQPCLQGLALLLRKRTNEDRRFHERYSNSSPTTCPADVLDTPTGRRRASFYGATAEEANNAKFQALADQARGVLFSDPGKLTTGVYLQSWLSDTARYQVSEGTYSCYERTCRNHLVPFFGRIKLRELSPAHVRAFKAARSRRV
jgi:Phage integrase, N-terminal SAM-like domain